MADERDEFMDKPKAYIKCGDGAVVIGYAGETYNKWDWFGLYEADGVDPFDWGKGFLGVSGVKEAALSVVASVAKGQVIPNWGWATLMKETGTNRNQGNLQCVYWSWDYEQSRYWMASHATQELNCEA